MIFRILGFRYLPPTNPLPEALIEGKIILYGAATSMVRCIPLPTTSTYTVIIKLNLRFKVLVILRRVAIERAGEGKPLIF